MTENNKTSGGLGFCGLLTIVFITLRLIKVINWPWIWVLAPVWIPAAIGLAAVIICVLLVVIQAGRK
jgi:hypothetical protein